MLSFAMIPRRSRATEENGEAAVTRLFEEFFTDPFGLGSGRLPELRTHGFAWVPSLDVSESEDAITVKAEVPGVDPENIDISVEGDRLAISGEKKAEAEEKKENFYRAERRFGKFERQIALPENVDRDKITADYKNGIVTITLAKAEAEKPKRIAVSVPKN